MKQRVVIAMALACNPELLLADEPTTALDVTIQAQVLEMIAELRKKYNTAMILITHDLGVVAATADDVAVVYAGEILEYGTKEEIFLHPAHPYTVGLFGAIPDINSDAKRLTNIEGLPPDPTDLPAGCCFNPRCPRATEECRSKKFPMVEVRPNHFVSCGYAETAKTAAAGTQKSTKEGKGNG
jgi:peptide/nickel transport system ATP-binding protein